MPERIIAHNVQDTVGAYRTRQPQSPRRDLYELDPVLKWTPQAIPQRPLMPLHDGTRPIAVAAARRPPTTIQPFFREPVERGELRPDASTPILWFAPLHLTLTDFALTVRREVLPGGAIATTGGSAVLSVSLYDHQSGPRRRGFSDLPPGVPVYPVLPAPQYGLTVDLQLPPGVAAAAPLITVSPLAGAATIAVELTEAGVLAWRSALEQNAGHTIAGAVRATASVPTVNAGNWFGDVETRPVDTPLGTLLAGRGSGDVRQIDPQQTISATVVVVGSQLVTASTVALRPSDGQAPTSAVFGPTGGRTDVAVITQNPRTIRVDWRADVVFMPPGWPVVPASGRLDATDGWISIIKPEAWCVGYVLAFVPVDAGGRPVPAASRAGDRLQGVLNFTASYVSGPGLLSTAFEAEYNRPTSLVLPRYPDRPFGDLVLTVFAHCGGTLGQASRKLGAADVVVAALAYPDGRVELRTGTDLLPESSGMSALLTRLGALVRD